MSRSIISRIKEDPDYLKNSARKKPARKKTKYKRITFKISESQKEALEYLCRRQQTTPIRFLKSVVKKHTAQYKPEATQTAIHTEKQLQLFDFPAE